MAFDWKKYLKIAEFLHQQSNNSSIDKEAALRSAVSRAYFALYCNAKKYAINNLHYEVPTPQEIKQYNINTHEHLRNHLKSNGLINIVDDLNTLRILRNQCDYDDNVNNLDKETQNALCKVINCFRWI